jgi:hypothetical protein
MGFNEPGPFEIWFDASQQHGQAREPYVFARAGSNVAGAIQQSRSFGDAR